MKKTQAIITRYAQALVVLLAFTLMVLFSYIFVSYTERKYLRNNAQDAISYMEVSINSDLLEPKTFLGSVSETIRNMIMHNSNIDEVHDYIKYINNYVGISSASNQMLGIRGFYGFFDIFNDEFLPGVDDWILPEGYSPRERPWYIAAVKASGNVGMTQPYIDVFTNNVSITFSRRIFDDEGNALGVMCLDIMLDRIREHVVNTQFAQDGYGFLLSENFNVIAHPQPSMIGTLFDDIYGETFTPDDNDALDNGGVLEFITDDYRGIQSIIFLRKLENGWYMGIVTPSDNYFRSTREMAVILAALGAIFATMLIWMLLRISSEKANLDERVKMMFDGNPLVAYIFNNDYKVIDCNQNAVTLFDLSSKQEFCDRFYELLPEYQPDGRLTAEIGNEITQKTLEEGSNCFEWTYQKLNGELIPCEITCVRVIYKDNFSIVGYLRDLREQKKMLKMIEKRTHLLDTVNNIATILLSNSAGESFEASLMKSFELIGRCMDVDRVQIWRNEIIDGELHFAIRYEWLSEYGESCCAIPYGLHFPYSMKKDWEKKFLQGENINGPLSELPDEDREFLGIYGMKSIVILPMFLDGNFWGFFSIDDCRNEITLTNEEISILDSAGLMMTSAVNRNIQTTKIREAEERTRIMIDAAPLCACFWDKNLKLIDCNQEAVKMFELSDKQEFMDKFTQLSPEYQPDGITSVEKGILLVRKALEEGYSRFEWMHQKLNGEQIPVEVTCVRVKHREEYTVTEYIRDLREQRAMINEMRKAEIAEESSKAKSSFLAKMSHEIRTPMNAILGITEIQIQNESLPGETKDALERIYSSGDMLLGIINDILDLSKIESGKLEIVPVQYDIASFIHDTVQLNIMRFESKPIDFILDISENIPALLIGDELRIKQILNNLISNAFKYTDKGIVNFNVSVEATDSMDEAILVFRIIDTGQGMTGEQIANLGSEYARFNLEANRKTEGTGLGMNITMSLIYMMNGDISVESTPGIGTTFTVKLPQAKAGPETIGKELADNLMMLNHNSASKIRTMQIKQEFMPYGHVLVVDDVETNLYVAKGLLAPYGLLVDVAISGYEAINKIKNGNVYDIVFMDHMMPKMDGIEAANIIRSTGYTQPIVALTANALAGQAEMFKNKGFDDFISKPIDIRQMNAVLNKLIRDKQPPEVIEESRRHKNNLLAASSRTSIDSHLAEFFIRDAKRAASILETVYINKCRSDDDISTLIINTHGMKSALANIKENDLSIDAAKLEQAGRDQNISYILTELPAFLEQLYSVIHRYTPDEESHTQASPDQDDIPYLKEKILDIRAACAVYNKKAAKDALSKLKEKTWSPSVKEWLGTITGSLLHSDFDEITKNIDLYLQQ